MKKMFYKFCLGVCISGIAYAVGTLIINFIIGWNIDFIATTFHETCMGSIPVEILCGALFVVLTTTKKEMSDPKR